MRPAISPTLPLPAPPAPPRLPSPTALAAPCSAPALRWQGNRRYAFVKELQPGSQAAALLPPAVAAAEKYWLASTRAAGGVAGGGPGAVGLVLGWVNGVYVKHRPYDQVRQRTA